MRRHVRRIISLATVAVAVAVVVGATLVLSGRTSIVTTNGVSMNPVYYQGDLVVVQRSHSYRAGDIAAYREPGADLVVLHRIIGGDSAGFVFKGDNNESVDPRRPRQGQVLGRAVLHIPRGGIWLHRLTTPPLLALYAFLLLTGGHHAAASTRRHRRKDLRTMPPRHRAQLSLRLSTLPRSLQRSAVAAAVIGVAGLTLSAAAWARPPAHTVGTKARPSSQMAFSYSAHVPRSPAYDGTTVTAPKPIFRQLANAVDVSYRYTGRPGGMTLSTVLAAANEWSTRIPLGQRRLEPVDRGSVRLDLSALEHRAAGAAKVIGLPQSEVTVSVVADVRFDDGGTFTPRLELVLDPLVMKLRSPLSARSADPKPGSRRVATHLSLLGRSIDTATARAVGAGTLSVALLIASLVALASWPRGPAARADRNRARYRDLIVPVLPIAPHPGRPVVDVPDVASLARLADRYGLLILHWSDGDLHTFVVQEEGTTFRCRPGSREARLVVAEPNTAQPCGVAADLRFATLSA